MDKRNVMKGMAAGTLALFAAGTGGRSAFAAETPDWLDELLKDTGYYEFEVMRHFGNDRVNRFIRVYRWQNQIGVQHTDVTYGTGEESYKIVEERFYDITYHDSLKEAYLYAKELKEKYYGQA